MFIKFRGLIRETNNVAAERFVNAVIMLKYKNEMQFRYYNSSSVCGRENTCVNFMSRVCLLKTAYCRSHLVGKLLPIFIILVPRCTEHEWYSERGVLQSSSAVIAV